jgi:hypothetical protein
MRRLLDSLLLAIHWDTDFDTALPANSLHARKRREFYTHLSFGVQSKMDFSDWRGVKVKPIQWNWQALAALGGFDVAAGQFQTAQPHHRVTNIFRTETMSREHCFRVADHPGVIAWWLESKYRAWVLLGVGRYTSGEGKGRRCRARFPRDIITAT